MTKGGGRGNAPPGMEWAEDPDYDKADLTEAHIKSAYRMSLPSHMGDTDPCKRNCRHNPRCLAQIGEKTWFEMEIDDEEEELELEDELVRQDGLPAGLRNLGNTCYVNSFLQIWFHNTKFRQSLYDWDPGEDPEEQDNESILDAELYEPKSKVASLQVLFSMMQYTKRKYVDPADFICKLGLDPSVQQDAQEFSKLFLSRLEDTLSHQATKGVKSMIQTQFRGEYAYVTSCLACKIDSVRPEHFYELDLPLTGNKTLAECLADFLHKEKMTGDERYYCEQCQSKQEAIRCCKLRELPPVLNLQLNRFQYDMQLGRKKKLNSNIQFPEELDMGGYLPEGAPRAVYHLTGVLMHVGPDANHGHYIAHIQELETGNWFKFSDECVVPIQGKTLKLGSQEEATKKGKKAGKGAQNSNNAYMLVYMLQESLMEIREVELKEAIKRQAVRRAAVARIQERSRRKAEEERRRLEEEEEDEEDEENGNEVMTILEKVTDDEEEKNEEPTKNKILEKVERSDSVDTETSVNKPEENGKESLEKEKIVNITLKVKDRRQSSSSVGSQGSQDSSYLFSNTRVFPRIFPQHLKTKIDRDNLEFDEEQEARHHARMAEIHDQQNKRRTMILQYKGLRWDSEDEDGKMGTLDPDNQDSEEEDDSDDESWEFLPLDWLMSYLESPGTAGVIETRHLLCLHSKLDIDKLTEVKLVDSNMATQLYSDNGEGAGPRLNHEHLCRYCVNNKARLLSLECRMSRDNQFLAQERSPQDGTGFWVGKKSFLRWRHLARTDLEDQIVEEVQHWKWQEETRMQAFREEQQRRILEMQKAKLQSIRGRVGAGAGFRGKGAAARTGGGERRDQVEGLHGQEGLQANGNIDCEPSKQIVEPKPRTGELKGEMKQEVEVGKDSSLSLTDLQAKLQRMGTNVSVAPAGVGGRHPGAMDNNTGISVIKNGESFKLANIAEVKLNFSEEDRARNKPSCLVKPIVQSPPVKPSLAVKPFNVKPPAKQVNGTSEGEPVAKKACVLPRVNGEGDVCVRNGANSVNGHVQGLSANKQPEAGDTVRCNVSSSSSLDKLTNGELDSRTSSRSTSTDSQSSDPKTEDSEVSSQTNNEEGSECSGAKSDTCGSHSPDKTSGEDSPDKTSGEESEISIASSAPSISATVKSSDTKISPPNNKLKRPPTGYNGHNKDCVVVEESFNSDIMCPHGNLRVEQRFRQLISRAAWHRLRTYFRNPKTFQFGSPVCSECEEETNAATVQREKWREEANRQKARLADLFGDKGRPEWSKPTTRRVFLLSSHFVMAWRGFVRGLSGGKSEVREPITDVTNKMLVCEEHKGLLYPPLTDWENHPDPCVVMVHEEEWREIKQMFNVDLEIRVERTNTSQGPILTTTPGICSICVSNRQEAEAEDRLRYTNQIVFVRRISPDAKIPQPEPDPEFCTSPVPGDSKRLKMVGGDVVRRSSRRPRVRGETQFVIHSDMLLRDFKVKLMEVFKVAPYDQNLCINGEYLTETQKTMGQLKILPGSLIFLRADEPTANAPCPQEDWVVQHPEQGFKGTGLLSS